MRDELGFTFQPADLRYQAYLQVMTDHPDCDHQAFLLQAAFSNLEDARRYCDGRSDTMIVFDTTEESILADEATLKRWGFEVDDD